MKSSKEIVSNSFRQGNYFRFPSPTVEFVGRTFEAEKVPEGRMRLRLAKDIKLALAILFMFVISFSHANENNTIIQKANTEYSKGNYANAIKLYESVLSTGNEAPELYYNLGNAYYKSNNISHAILNYERAKKIDPDNEDVIFNLKLANQKIEDKIDNAPQLFFSEWKHGMVDLLTEKGWSWVFIGSIALGLILLSMYFASSNRNARQIGFWGGSTLIIASFILFFIAKDKYNITKYSNDAIITTAAVTANGSPNDKGTKLFILHEGTKVKITQKDDDWTEIKIANGNIGWVKSNNLTAI